MKYGVRKPNIKKSIKARTTGKVKRVLSSVFIISLFVRTPTAGNPAMA